MEYSEKYGKDVDEAVRLALDELGLQENQVMVTVLEESSKGFLGLGSKLAKVRVEKIEEIAQEEDLSQAEALAAAEKPRQKATHDFRKKGKEPSNDQGTTASKRSSSKSGDEKRRENRSEGGRSSGRAGRGGRDRDRDHGRRERQKEREIELDISMIHKDREPIENLVPDPGNRSSKFLEDVISKMGLNVQVEGFYNDDCNYIEVKGVDSRIVIGKRGQTLDALQYLTNLASNKDAEKYKRVIIDVEGYRSRRENTLELLAVKLARKVLSSGRSARLEPMNPYERRVIHATLQQVDGVTTRSEGEEPYRRVIIERK